MNVHGSVDVGGGVCHRKLIGIRGDNSDATHWKSVLKIRWNGSRGIQRQPICMLITRDFLI